MPIHTPLPFTKKLSTTYLGIFRLIGSMRKIIVAFTVFTALLVACKQEDKTVYTHAAANQSFAEQLTFDVVKTVLGIIPDYVANKSYTSIAGLSVTASPSIENSTYPKVVTMNFGSGITGSDGKVRKGKLLVSVPDSTVSIQDLAISFENYFINATNVLGGMTLEYESLGNHTLNFQATGITLENGNGTMKWQGSATMDQQEGIISATVEDNVYYIAVTATGQDFNGTGFSMNSTQDHKIDFSCSTMIVQGASSIEPQDRDAQTVDYGDGVCDEIGVVSVPGGDQKNFTF